MARVEETSTSNGAGSSRATEPAEDIGALGLGACAERVSSPPASPLAMGLSAGAEQASSPPVPPLGMSLGAPFRPQREERAGPLGEAPEGIEEIPRVPPHPWTPLPIYHANLPEARGSSRHGGGGRRRPANEGPPGHSCIGEQPNTSELVLCRYLFLMQADM